MMRVLPWPEGEYERVQVIADHRTYGRAFEVAVREVDAALRELDTCHLVLAAVEPLLATEGVCIDSYQTLLEWQLKVSECAAGRRN